MARLIAFTHLSIDGYFCDADDGMMWTRKNDPEWQIFNHDGAARTGIYVLGRVTYDLLSRYYMSSAAHDFDPVMTAAAMVTPKVVFSTTLKAPKWQNTTVMTGDLVASVQKLKTMTDKNVVIIGSGTIVSQLAVAKVIDEFQTMTNMIHLGLGRTLFHSLKRPLAMSKTETGNSATATC